MHGQGLSIKDMNIDPPRTMMISQYLITKVFCLTFVDFFLNCRMRMGLYSTQDKLVWPLLFVAHVL